MIPFGLRDIKFLMKIAGADLFHLGYPTIMRRMFEHPEELLEIYRRVKELWGEDFSGSDTDRGRLRCGTY